MGKTLLRVLNFILCVTLLLSNNVLIYAANYKWVQSDWFDGITTVPTGHDSLQDGQYNWKQYDSESSSVDTSSTAGQISLSFVSGSWSQNSDIDFNAGSLSNLQIIGAGDTALLKVIPYSLDLGNGVDGNLVVDGQFAPNSTDGQIHGINNPYLIDSAKKYANVSIQNQGAISVTTGRVLTKPVNVSVVTTSQPGPGGGYYYGVTALDRFGRETNISSDVFSYTQSNLARQISWSPVSGAVGYRVYRTKTPAQYLSPARVCPGSETSVATLCIDNLSSSLSGMPPFSATMPTPGTSVLNTGGQVADATYYYVLTGIDSRGYETAPGGQRTVTISGGNNQAAVNISWTSVNGATGYKIYRTTQDGVYNSPALICEVGTGVTSCQDVLNKPITGAPPRRYPMPLGYGDLNIKVQGTFSVGAGSTIGVDGKGFTGGDDNIPAGCSDGIIFGTPGFGPGGGGSIGSGGGYGTRGSSNDSTNTALRGGLGHTYGDSLIAVMLPGSGGASGYSTTSNQGGKGGSGGGAIRISADTLTLNGIITANGAAGGSGNDPVCSSKNFSDAGGGGSGGAIYLDGNTLVKGGNINASGGAGGQSGSGSHYYNNGGSGGNGRIRLAFQSITGSGSVSPSPLVGSLGIYTSPVKELSTNGVEFKNISWVSSELAGNQLQFQISTSKDGVTWTGFLGINGTSGSYYNKTVCGGQPTCTINPIHKGDRFIRYMVWFEQTSIGATSSLTMDSVTITYDQPSPLQFLTSSQFDTLEDTNRLRRLNWDAVVPSGDSVGIQLRTASDQATLQGTAWSGTFSTILPDCSATINNCTTQNIPVNDSDFEQCTSKGANPPGWTVSNAADTGCDSFGISPGYWEARVRNNAYVYQPLSLQAGITYKFSVWARILVTSGISQTATLWVSTVPGSGTALCSASVSTYSASFTEISCQYTPQADTTVYLALRAERATFYEAAFDQVTVTETRLTTAGLSTIAVADASGLKAGDRIVLTDSAKPSQEELLRITAVDYVLNQLTLDQPLQFNYTPGSALSNFYLDSSGRSPLSQSHGDGLNDRWFQYKIILSQSGLTSPVFQENRIEYAPNAWTYQPDGIITDPNGIFVEPGENIYGVSGSGAGGSASMSINPNAFGGQALYPVQIQNDGQNSGMDTYTIVWNSPSDAAGKWVVVLNDGNQDITSPVDISAGDFRNYTLKITPSSYAPANSTQTVILDIQSGNEYGKADSIKAVTKINKIYQTDGVLGTSGTSGDGLYDPSGNGAGGSASISVGPGETASYQLALQNEGNISDRYTLSQQTICGGKPLPSNWKILVYDGSSDHDITGQSWTTPIIPTKISSGWEVNYIIKILASGEPITCDTVLKIESIGVVGGAVMDSVTATTVFNATYKVDGIIYSSGAMGSGCEMASEIIGDGRGDDDGVCETGEACYPSFEILGDSVGDDDGTCEAGEACYSNINGDNIYGETGSGKGGCAALDIAPGSTRKITVGIQNEGNVPDSYQLSWSPPSGWTVVMLETLNDDSIVKYNTSPVNIPTPTAGDPSKYNPGEMPFFTFEITPTSPFTPGSVIFNIKSTGNESKGDSVKAIINSGDTTPPASAVLSLSNTTVATSVKVSWPAPGDDGNSGTARSYDLRYSTSAITDANFAKASRVGGCQSGETILRQPKSANSSESCTVSQLFVNTGYYFALKTTDDAGNVSAISTCNPASCMAATGSSGDVVTPGAISDLNAVYTRVIQPMNNPEFAGTTYSVSLKWTAKADDGNITSSGPAATYDIRYSTKKIVEDGVTPGAGELFFNEATPVKVLFRNDSKGIVPVCLDGVTDLAQLDQAFIANQGELLPPKSSGGAECYTVIVENKVNTGGNIIDDRTQNTRFYFAVKALDERGKESLSNISSISNVTGSLTSLVPYAYNMVSVPYIPNPNTPADVFGDDVGAPLYTYNWDSRGPNADSGCYNGEPGPNNREILNDGAGDDDGICDTGEACYICSKLTSIKEGLGHFLWVPYGNHTLDVPLSSLPSSSSASYSPNCDDGAGGTFPCYIFSLQNGWNIIGNTFDKEINLTNRDVNGNGIIESNERGVYVRKTGGGGGVATFQTAVTAKNWIDNDIFTYNGVNNTYEICDQDQGVVPLGTKCPVVIQPWKSYWIRVHGGGGATFDLLIPE